jgi:PleD family two-component response regulator
MLGRGAMMGQSQQKRRAVLIVEDDAELRSLTAALLEDEQLDTIECESAEAALAMLIGGREVAMIFADVRLGRQCDHRVAARGPRAAVGDPRVGWLSMRSANDSAFAIAAVRRGLGETGHVDGQNVAIEYRWAYNQYDRLPALAADLVQIGTN